MSGKVYNYREFRVLLKNNGYNKDRQTGGHEIWKKDDHPDIIINQTLNCMVMRRLIKENHLKEK